MVALKLYKGNTRDEISELKSASSYKLFSLTLELTELEALGAVKAIALEMNPGRFDYAIWLELQGKK